VLTADCASDLNLNSVQLRQPDNSEIPAASRGARIQAATAVGLLGDFDADMDIDLRDFTLLSGYWQPVNNTAGDIGPASGTVPALTVTRDGVVNFEDLFVFTRMWNWYQSRPAARPALAKTASTLAWRITPSPEAGNLYICELMGQELSNLAMAHLSLRYNPEQLSVRTISAGSLWDEAGATTALFTGHREESGSIDVSLARLAERSTSAEVAGSGAILRLLVEERTMAGALCDWKLESLDLRDAGSYRLQALAPEVSALRFSELPVRYELAQNYPNPFNSRTEVRFSVPKSGMVHIAIYNVLGQPVRTLVHEPLEAGIYRRIWDGRSDTGQEVVSGLYLLRMEAGEYSEMRRMAFVK
ncbi:MAG TPA: FlgD immunoglobulin-like domain containing protein, partial [bacterium]|nr:FlgD immunoglobulin-like domain containing protein [bacterium]